MKFIAVLNKKLPVGQQLNALSHLALGLFMKYDLKQYKFSEFTSANNMSVSYLTDHPFIILRAKNSNHLRRFQQELIADDLPHSAFYSNMIDGGTVAEQIATVAASELEELDYVGVVTFGNAEAIDKLTKRFSLYRDIDTSNVS